MASDEKTKSWKKMLEAIEDRDEERFLKELGQGKTVPWDIPDNKKTKTYGCGLLLGMAIERGMEKAVDAMLELGADCSWTVFNDRKITSVDCAMVCESENILKIVIPEKMPPGIPGEMSLLMKASKKQEPHALRYLRDHHGVYFKEHMNKQWTTMGLLETPLSIAALNGSAKSLRILLDEGADINKSKGMKDIVNVIISGFYDNEVKKECLSVLVDHGLKANELSETMRAHEKALNDSTLRKNLWELIAKAEWAELSLDSREVKNKVLKRL